MHHHPPILTILFLFLITPLLSAQPDWAITPSDFQYTMTITGVAVFECTEGNDENDIVAAFINGEVRGVQSFETESDGRKYAYMVVYDNDFSGNEITFKIYDASEDAIFETINVLGFTENGNHGNSSNPFEFKTDHTVEDIILSQDSIYEETLAGTTVAELLALNENDETMPVAFEFVDDSLGTDNSYFSINNNSLVLEQEADIDVKPSYLIHLSATTGQGCSFEKTMILTVVESGGVNAVGQLGAEQVTIALYPNPVSDFLYFETTLPIDFVRISDLTTGQLVQHKRIGLGQRSINVTNLPGGVYSMVFLGDGYFIAKKVIVRH